jgi:hypothetical protein
MSNTSDFEAYSKPNSGDKFTLNSQILSCSIQSHHIVPGEDGSFVMLIRQNPIHQMLKVLWGHNALQDIPGMINIPANY